MKRVTRLLAALGFAAALGVLVVGLASAASPSGQKAAPHFKSPKFTLQATLVIRSDEEQAKKGADGKWHDAYLPADFAVMKGVPVKVTIYNYDDMPHSFTASGLHVNQIIPSGSEGKPSKVTFTFTPKKAGMFAWHCDPKCDPWSMAHWGFMKGHITVL